jgi:adenine-specific DNA-methyltransferase
MVANRWQLKVALQKPYDRILFSKEVLSTVFGSGFSLSASLVPAPVQPNISESSVIDKVWIYGNILLEDNTEITCYEILLQPKVRIEQSKVAIQHYVRKLLTAGQAALINFVAPVNKNVWRLTLVAKDSELTDKGIKEKTTHAKRYTFLLGPSESCKTAAERFEVLSTEKKLDFNSLVGAFSVEKLSKIFFNEYKEHYDKFVNSLTKSNFKKSAFNGDEKAIRDFTKKLLGRIVFLYFVQKKGWLGASDKEYKDGRNDFIMYLFTSSGAKDAFYSSWLTKLFFETLNHERIDDEFIMPDGKKVKIPYLNGGLFDKEDNDEHIITFKYRLFHNPDNPDDPKYRGFLDFLNAFNFTVYEDSPDDHTVAVDPEMLGHIFENLLEDNKDKGAFYTPKEIVHYMCQESLTEYLCTTLQIKDEVAEREAVNHLLKNKVVDDVLKPEIAELEKALDYVKICDPAIGSGAFPMGLLQEIFSIKELIAYETNKDWKPAETKLNIIQNSIYGVDIEKGAVDIARLRFWLSLVVDEENPKALPNLDYKIVVGDSLVSKFDGEIVEIDWERKSSVGKADEYVKNVQRLLIEVAEKQKKYFNPNSKNKKKLQAEIRNLKIELLINQLSFNKELYIGKTVQKGGFMPTPTETKHNTERQLHTAGFDKLIAKLKNLVKHPDEPFIHFDWKLDFPEVLNPYLVNEKGGFDIVIANPPYIGQKGNNELFQEVKKIKLGKDFHQRRMDYFYFFFHQAINHAKSNGTITFISTNYYITATYADKLRFDFKNRTSIRQLVNLNELKIFEAALGQHNLITILTKGVENHPVKVINTKKKGVANSNILKQILYGFDKDTSYYKMPNQNIYEGNLNYIRLQNETSSGTGIDSILETVRNSGKPLSKICNITQGIVTGADKLSKSHIEKYGVDGSIGAGIFVLSNLEVRKLSLSEAEKQFLKPFYKNSDVKKWITNESTNESLIYYTSKTDEKIGTNLIEHFEKYKPLLINRNTRSGTPVITSSVYDKYVKGYHNISYVMVASAFKRGAYYCISYARDVDYFELPKIVAPQRSPLNTFGYNESHWFAASDVHFIIKKDDKCKLKYILALLNSQLYYKWLYHRGKRKGETLELVLAPLSEIPIKVIPLESQKPFTTIADYIIFLKKQDLINISDKLMPTYLEQIIDGMVYELYFPELLKKHNREIIRHLGELLEFTEGMSDEQKMKICKNVFDRLNDKEHPIRINLFYMNSIPEIAIIEGKNQ